MIILSFTEQEFLASGLFVWENYCRRKLITFVPAFLLDCGGCFVDVIVNVIGTSEYSANSINHGLLSYRAAASVLWKNEDVVRNINVVRHRDGALKIVLGIRSVLGQLLRAEAQFDESALC